MLNVRGRGGGVGALAGVSSLGDAVGAAADPPWPEHAAASSRAAVAAAPNNERSFTRTVCCTRRAAQVRGSAPAFRGRASERRVMAIRAAISSAASSLSDRPGWSGANGPGRRPADSAITSTFRACAHDAKRSHPGPGAPAPTPISGRRSEAGDASRPPEGRTRRMIEDDSPSTSSSGVRAASSTKNTRPPGSRQSATRDQKGSNRPSGTCDSQNPKKDHVVKAIGLPIKDVCLDKTHPFAAVSRRGDGKHVMRCVHGGDVSGVAEQLAGLRAWPAASSSTPPVGRNASRAADSSSLPARAMRGPRTPRRGRGSKRLAHRGGARVRRIHPPVSWTRSNGHGGVRQLLTILAAAIGPGRAPDRRPHQFADSEYAASPASTVHRPLGRTACR